MVSLIPESKHICIIIFMYSLHKVKMLTLHRMVICYSFNKHFILFLNYNWTIFAMTTGSYVLYLQYAKCNKWGLTERDQMEREMEGEANR